MKKHTIDLRKGVTVQKGDYLRRGKEPYVILIKEIKEAENLRKESVIRVDYQTFELERMTQHLIEDQFESRFKKNFENAEILSKSDFKTLWKEFENQFLKRSKKSFF